MIETVNSMNVITRLCNIIYVNLTILYKYILKYNLLYFYRDIKMAERGNYSSLFPGLNEDVYRKVLNRISPEKTTSKDVYFYRTQKDWKALVESKFNEGKEIGYHEYNDEVTNNKTIRYWNNAKIDWAKVYELINIPEGGDWKRLYYKKLPGIKVEVETADMAKEKDNPIYIELAIEMHGDP